MEPLENSLIIANSKSEIRGILQKLRWRQGFQCPRCHAKKGYNLPKRMLIECSKCGLQTSATSGTALHGARKLNAWTRLIMLLYTNKSFNCVYLAADLKTRYSTAWLMLQKVRLALENSADLHNLKESSREPTVASSESLRSVLFKRSREIDLTMIKSKKESGPQTKEISQFITYIKTVYHGISRKYSQLYATELGFKTGFNTPESLLRILIRGSPKNSAKILEYKSPYLIRL
ncbi:MAG: IS1595 family transposase [Cyanobacteriota/Melainabacteria group bacterium]